MFDPAALCSAERSMLRVVVLALTLVAIGCLPVDVDQDGVIRIVCAGDSNTARGWPTPETVRWCEYAAMVCQTSKGVPVQWYNRGIGGAALGAYQYQDDLVAYAASVKADAVILAYGTNDVGLLDATPEEYAASVQATCGRLGPYVGCYAMSFPPHPWDGFDVCAYNAALESVVLAGFRIDRTSAITLLDDTTHLDDQAEMLLGARVAAMMCP